MKGLTIGYRRGNRPRERATKTSCVSGWRLTCSKENKTEIVAAKNKFGIEGKTKMVEGQSELKSRHLAASALLSAVALIISSGAAMATGVSGDAIGGTGRTLTADAIGGTGRSASSDAIGGTGRKVSTDAIGGTGRTLTADAIGGTGRSASSDAIGGTGRQSKSALFAGQIESVDAAASKLTILGQTIQTAAAKTLAAGQYIFVFGHMTPASDMVVTAVRVVPDLYVPGASRVTITGRVSEVNAALGVLMVGRQAVDYTALLASGKEEFVVGSLVSLTGIQPLIGGVIIATN